MTRRSDRRTTARSRTPIAVGYLRRSTDRQDQSIPDQKRAVEAYATENGFRLARFYVDDAISGTTATKRPGFQEMVADAQSQTRPFEYVVVYDVKRFGRLDNDEAGYYRHILRTHGVEVCYTSENFNGDATDDLLRPVKQWQARQESKDLAKVTIRGQLSRVEGGWWMGGAPPYGYDLAYQDDRGEFLFGLRFLPDGRKEVLDQDGQQVRILDKGEAISVSKRDKARLVPSNAERVEVVRRIFQMSAHENRGLRAIADVLNSEGLPSPRGPGWARIYSGMWALSTVRSILENPHYVGDLVWNRRTDARFFQIQEGRAVERKVAYGVRLEPNAEEDWVVIRDAHPALIDRAIWVRAKEVRKGRATSKAQKGKSRRVVGGWTGKRSRYLLSGLVTCGRCGGRYEGCYRIKGKRRSDGTRVKTYYYGCGNYIRHGRSACSFGRIPQEELEQEVVRQVLVAFAPFRGPEGRKRLAQEIREARETTWEEGEAALQRTQEALLRIREEIERLLDSLSPANREHVDQRLGKLDRERTALERKLGELEALAARRPALEAKVEEAASFVGTLEAMLRDGAPDQRVAAIRRAVRVVQLQKVGDVNVETVPL
jgi:DNA invertase Pin-like site-specific DNA recombinase